MINYFFKNSKDKSLKAIKKLKTGAWINIEDSTEKEILDFCEEFNLDSDICLDALDPFEVPRVESEDGKTYIFARFAYGGDDKIATSPILFIITSKFIVTISSEPLPFLKRLLNNKAEFSTTQKIKFLAQIFSEIHEDYERLVNSIHKSIRNLSKDLEHIDNKDVGKFVHFETILNDFLFGLEPDKITLNKIHSEKYLKLDLEEKDSIEELFIENQQIVAICKSNLKGIVNIRESHSAIISNNLNKTMKLLTSFTMILTIPTMVFSLYGMNVDLPFQGSPLAFFGVLVFTILISFGILTFFKKMDFL